MCVEICFQSGLLFVLCLLLAVFISQRNVSSFFKTCAEFVLVEFICYTGADVCIITETTSDILRIQLQKPIRPT